MTKKVGDTMDKTTLNRFFVVLSLLFLTADFLRGFNMLRSIKNF